MSGVGKYVHFPPEIMAAAAPWGVWLGSLVPVDGVWRVTGSGFWLSPIEGDALAEYMAELVGVIALKEAGLPDDRIPDPGPARFGQADPYGVYAGAREQMPPDFVDVAGMVIASAAIRLASWVWFKRAGQMDPTNTDGDPLVVIDATRSGGSTGC